MKKYIVGGWVRDTLLSRRGATKIPSDKDWVVVDANPQLMLQKGYLPVGKDFPVFLHPRTHEEYALARTERKSGHGYKGFVFYADETVTLEEDLKRRDLTINAMAMDEKGNLYDPYGGLKDLNDKIFRHVSEAFIEDPLRVIRAARFSAKFPDFQFAEETLLLMREMINSGETDTLVPERVGKELLRALQEERASRFFETLKECGYLARSFPGWNLSDRVLRLIDACPVKSDALERFAASFLETEFKDLTKLFSGLRVSRQHEDFAELFAATVSNQPLVSTNPREILKTLKLKDALRRFERFEKLLDLMAIVEPGTDKAFWIEATRVVQNVNVAEVAEKARALKESIPEKIQEAYEQALEKYLEQFPNQ